jgi:hypothetical protein
VGIVNKPVECAIAGGRVADLFVPASCWQLLREDERADLTAVLANLGGGSVWLRVAGANRLHIEFALTCHSINVIPEPISWYLQMVQ